MIKAVLLWIVLFSFIFGLIGTWKKWTKNGAIDVVKVSVQATIASLIVTAFMVGIYILF